MIKLARRASLTTLSFKFPQTADFAIQDLDKYGKALDKAIMEYHGHKMMEINDTAQALWNRCYQGSGENGFLTGSRIEARALGIGSCFQTLLYRHRHDHDQIGQRWTC